MDYPRKTMFEQLPEELLKGHPAPLEPPPASAPSRPRTMVEQIPPAAAGAPPAMQLGATEPPPGLVEPAEAAGYRDFVPLERPPTPRLLILDDNSRTEGEWVRLRTARFVIGRTEGDFLLPHDSALSGRHVEIVRECDGGRYHWHLHDLGSKNGTFVRASKVALKEGQELMLGMRRYEYRGASHPAGSLPDDELSGTRSWHAPKPLEAQQAAPALVELGAEGEVNRFPLVPDEMTLGSDSARATIVIRDDPFVSPIHATIKPAGPGRWTIHCSRATNGLWVRIETIPLDSDCEFQIGEQRCRFECPQAR